MTNLLFSHQQLLHQRFLESDLGQLYVAIPFERLAKHIPSPKFGLSGKGCEPWFDLKGGIALLILKHYTGLSDEMLIDRINTDWCMQMFCGIQLKPHEQIRDKNLPSSWRGYIGRRLDIHSLQKELAHYWKPHLNETNISSEDATCYESRIEYPTDIKLLWQSCSEIYLVYQQYRKQYKLRTSRINYNKYKVLFLNYQRCKKKTKRKEKKLRKQLLKFLYRLLGLGIDLKKKHNIILSGKQTKRVNTIITLYNQQHTKAYGDKNEPIKNRIVSLSKPYIRPIVRGKEVKAVEFGAKVNKLQVDGISFIQHFSYDAFNEGTQLKKTIELHQELFGKCTHHSADAIYATNQNRSYCTGHTIVTNFIPKGKQKEQHIEQSKIMRNQLNKQRGTVLEGSFGNEKNHYLLAKVNARNEHTEKCWIFFGILAANASIISQRMVTTKQKARAA
jgi:translation initiation factor 2 beta subunit (eIF-2beta)/eIF-5